MQDLSKIVTRKEISHAHKLSRELFVKGDIKGAEIAQNLAQSLEQAHDVRTTERLSGASLLPQQIAELLQNEHGMQWSAIKVNKGLTALGLQESYKDGANTCYELTPLATALRLGRDDQPSPRHHRIRWGHEVVVMLANSISVDCLGSEYHKTVKMITKH